jgi:3-hydroxyacyl-[acyl-carrier-protein] dehydratase
VSAGGAGSPEGPGSGPAPEAGDPLDDPVALLPHRPPFRFVDRVVELVPGERVDARYQVTGQEEFLAGHFPGRPIFPGVLQLEALAQAGAIGVLADPQYTGRLPLFGGVEEVRFRRQVVPGDELSLAVTLDRLSSRGGWGTAVATVGGKTTCSARLFFVLAPA